MDASIVFSIAIGPVGIIIQCIWLILAFRAVNAHEKLAEANKKQSEAVQTFIKEQKRKARSSKEIEQ